MKARLLASCNDRRGHILGWVVVLGRWIADCLPVFLKNGFYIQAPCTEEWAEGMAALKIKKTRWKFILHEANEQYGMWYPTCKVDDGQTRCVGLRKRNSVDLVQEIGNYARYAVHRWLMVTQVHNLWPRLVSFFVYSPWSKSCYCWFIILCSERQHVIINWLATRVKRFPNTNSYRWRCKKTVAQWGWPDGLPEGADAWICSWSIAKVTAYLYIAETL